ncbi:MAG TPA: Hsp20 family protein [Rhizomicrobium sp.]|nr:Hsp20 family protein [Rhizomicrobium sp.]
MGEAAPVFGPRNQIPGGCRKAARRRALKMNRNLPFNSPFLLGFDHLERLLERTAKAATDGYPPYNIEESGGDRFRITLAVAGFTRDELSVTVEDNQLVIRGKQTESGDRTFLHRGIAARQFQRAFVLADGIEVTGAELENGLLSIEIARPKPNAITRKIEIKNGGAA